MAETSHKVTKVMIQCVFFHYKNKISRFIMSVSMNGTGSGHTLFRFQNDKRLVHCD